MGFLTLHCDLSDTPHQAGINYAKGAKCLRRLPSSAAQEKIEIEPALAVTQCEIIISHTAG